MDTSAAVDSLAALAQETRLNIFRLLVRYAPLGLPAGEIARQLDVSSDRVLAAGDHFNDLPMLSLKYARLLAAPANAVDAVKSVVHAQGGYVSRRTEGDGVVEAMKFYLESGPG